MSKGCKQTSKFAIIFSTLNGTPGRVRSARETHSRGTGEEVEVDGPHGERGVREEGVADNALEEDGPHGARGVREEGVADSTLEEGGPLGAQGVLKEGEVDDAHEEDNPHEHKESAKKV